MDNENKNEELFDVPVSVDEDDQPDLTTEPEQESSLEDQTVARLSVIGDEIDAAQLGGIPVTPFDEDGGDDAESDQDELCVMCGEKPADKSFGENYDLCAECRKQLIQTRVSFPAVIVFILLIGVSLFGWLLSASQIPSLQAVSEAYDYAQGNHLYSAVKSISGATSIGWKTARTGISLYNKSGYLSGIPSAVETYFYDKTASAETKLTWADKVGKANLNAPWNHKIKEIYQDYNAAMEAYEKYYAYFSEYDEQLYYGEITADDVPYDDLIQKLEDAKKTEESTEGLAFISYCEYYLAKNCEKGKDAQIKFLKDVQEVRQDFTWLYLRDLTELLVETGDYEAAEEYCKQMIEINADDYYGEYFRAMILRKQEKYDEAIALMDVIIDDYENNGFYYAYYEAAINAFLKNDIKQALSYIQPCYEGEYLNYNTANFYALLSKLDQNEEQYQAAIELIETNEAQLSPTVEAYLNKKITAQEMFDGDGEPFEFPTKESEAAQ